MTLVPISAEYLKLDATLPFGLRDAAGRLLLAAGAHIDGADRLAALSAQPLFADAHESLEWRRRLGAAMDRMVRRNASLKEVATVRPGAAKRAPAEAERTDVPDAWDSLCGQLDATLRDAPGSADWLARLRSVRQRASRLGRQHGDASLYHLIHGCAQTAPRYSARHALLVMLVCEHAAPLLGWDDAAAASLGLAALSMNVAMTALQDLLADSRLPPTAAMREQIERHAEDGARWLREAGADTLSCDAVRGHHDRSDAERPLAELDPARQLARLLRRADIFTAKISARRTRQPMSPVQAAREACLGSSGVPDDIGGALLRATGLYPPGSFVELSNGERGIVVARGRRANLPWVASLVAPSGLALGEPALRDTAETRFAVRSAVAWAQIKVRPDHARILALR